MRQARRNQFSKDAISRKSDRFFLQLARDFYEAHGKVPLSTELGLHERRVIYRRFKTWQNFVGTALNRPAKQRHWSNEELLQWLRGLYERQQKFPTHTDINDESSSVAKLLYTRFGDLHTAIERAVGTSPRAEILKTLWRLTPPGCDTASTQEIHAELFANGFNISKQVVANTLDYLKRSSAVTGGRYSQTAWWSLTAKGRERLTTIKKERGDGKRRT